MSCWIPFDPYKDENPFGPEAPDYLPTWPVPVKDPKEGD